MVRHWSPWLRLGPASMLAAANIVIGCSGAEQTKVNAGGPDKKVAQGPGSSESDDDFTVAQPVPMALLDPTFIAENKERFDQSGAGGSYENAKESDCATKINPMDTSLDEYLVPKNFCISFNIMTVPGYAAGEMKSLLQSLITLSSKLFGKQGFFGPGFSTRKAVSLFDVRSGKPHVIGTASYAEVVVVNPGLNGERKRYRVNMYFPDQTNTPTKFSLNTSMEFSPMVEDENYADIGVSHYYLPSDTIYGQHLSAQYNTKTGEFSADFGTAPIDTAVPAKTSLRWIANSDYFLIQGGYVWQNDNAQRLGGRFAAPKYYKSYNNDVALFQSITQNDVAAKTVQSTAYVAEVDGALSSVAVDHTIWGDSSAGYTSEVVRYLVELLRDSGVNPMCSTLKSIIVSKLNQRSIPVPASIADLPHDNVCSTNTAATDLQVESLLKDSCQLIGINMNLNIEIEGERQTLEVALCRKLLEGLLLSNHQFIEVFTDSKTGDRSRQPKVEYITDEGLVQQLLSKEPPDEDYGGLQTILLGQEFKIDFGKFSALSWPKVESQGTEYFENARGQL